MGGIHEDSDSGDAAKNLVKLCDLSKTGNLVLDEFKVLIMLATEANSPEDERNDMIFFFRHIDKDNSGSLTVKELHEVFSVEFGSGLSETFILNLIVKCFKQHKSELNEG